MPPRRAPLHALASVVLLVACAAQPLTSTSPATPTASPVAASATPAATATASPVATPTASPIATPTASPIPDPQAVTPGPQEIVQAFYDWYLTDLAIAHLLARPDLTPALVEWLAAFDWGYNPIVCGNGLPARIQAESAEISGSSATVPTTAFFIGSEQPGPPVELTLGPTGWQISAVDCGF